MNYNLIPKAGFKVSEVSFGCMSLKEDTKENQNLIEAAADSGINLFDTADLYDKGHNEVLLGKALKSRRKNVHISTKVGNRWRKDGSGWDWYPKKNYILEAIDKSLARLQTDYIDLYLLHGGTIEDPADEVLEAFELLKAAGKIRAYGISSIRPNVIREYIKSGGIAAVMTQYSLLDRRPEEETLNSLLAAEVGVLARGTVAGGLLAGKPAAGYLGMPEGKVSQIVKNIKDALPGRTLNETAVRYTLAHPGVTTAVAGIRTNEQLSEAIAAAGSPPLNEKEVKVLQEVWEGNTYSEHR